MMLRVKFLLLNFAVGLSAVVLFQNSTSERVVTRKRVTFKETNAIQSVRTKTSNETIVGDLKTFPQNSMNEPDEKIISNRTIVEILRDGNTCRERASILQRYNVTNAQSSKKVKEGVKENANVSVFHCKVSKELLNGLNDNSDQLETFQGIIVLYPKESSSDGNCSPNSGREANNRRGSSFPRKKTERSKRDALLKIDQMESNTKVPQISHIYLGRSLYPFLTEESRIIGNDHTLPPPVFTGPTHNDHEK